MQCVVDVIVSRSVCIHCLHCLESSEIYFGLDISRVLPGSVTVMLYISVIGDPRDREL